MLAALETLEKAYGGTEEIREFILLGVDDLESAIDESVLQAVRAVNRLDFLRPCFEYLDQHFTIPYVEALPLVQSGIGGLPAPIFRRGDYVLNSTTTRITAQMIDRGLPTDRDHPLTAVVVGSGCGHSPAILERVGYSHIWAIEREHVLAEISRTTLISKGYEDIEVIEANGLKWLKRQPGLVVDTILVFAATNRKDHLQLMADHLAVGGRMVLPLGHASPGVSTIVQVIRTADSFEENRFEYVIFTGLIE